MLTYIGTRVLQLIPLLLALSMIIFIVIELPPGDYLTMYVLQLEAERYRRGGGDHRQPHRRVRARQAVRAALPAVDLEHRYARRHGALLPVRQAGHRGGRRTHHADHGGVLLDELRKQYVITARAKGIAEVKLLFKYPVRVAINPIVSTVGWLLPRIISSTPLVAIVLNLPTTGPMLLGALLHQDMYLAGSFVLILSVLTVIGTLLSDVLLAVLDPRIRYEGVGG